jgi:hypothetical protein
MPINFMIQKYRDENITSLKLYTAPKIVSIGYAIIKPFLHERTANKVLIFNPDSEGWKEAILAEVDADQLPACYGGTMTDPDGNPNCVTKVCKHK